jgi:predicted PurR-regulated permease PerM
MAVLSEILPSPMPRRGAPRLVGLAVLIGLLYYGKLFFVTVISALIISFILEPFVQFFMRLRLPRGPASFVACSLALLALYFGSLGAYAQISGLIQDLPSYVQRINDIGQSVVAKIESVENTLNQLLPKRMQERGGPQQAPPPVAPAKRRRAPEPQAPIPPAIQEVRITPEQPSVVNWLYGQVGQISEMLLAASFVPFLVYFMLSWRDHIRRSFLQLFDGENRGEVSRSLRGVAELSRAYIAGNFVLGMVLSVVTTGLFLFFRLPYALLVGPISGFLSLVPYVGLPLAVLPPALAALPVYTRLPQYLLLGTSVALLHLIAMNLLYPKVVGARVHLNPLAVTIALMFWGLLWGGAGLALAIPITAGIKAVCDNVSGLEPYGRLLGD